MTKLKDKVKYCLKKDPNTRNSDITLTIAVWLQFYGKLVVEINGKISIDLLSLYELPNQDNIKRHRAVIQNVENKYLPTSEEVRKKRKILEETWNNYIQTQNAYQTNPGY